ncbi:MAG: type II toxin-antitoxin system Phd/YefM family antitoxin [Acidobacteriota bacterium]|nr:type II toxin-antitoxin system Phd/YefM family antitoxin [Acidobacteriota bacterium]
MQTVREDQQSLSSLPEMASSEEEGRIQRPNGQVFVLRQEQAGRSALDVEGINLNVSTEEIVEFVRVGSEHLLRETTA